MFPAEADAISVLIAHRASAGDYSTAADLPALAAVLTTDLQSVNGDRHLRVIYTDEPVVDLDDPDAELAMWAQRADEAAGGIAQAAILASGIGLLELRPILYPSVLVEDRVAAAMTTLSGADALVIDVRNCLGGSPDTVALVCSYLFDGEPVHLNSMYERGDTAAEQWWTLSSVAGTRFGARKPVAVLTSSITFSGAEALAYDLQQLGRITVVGEQTGGGANPREGFRVQDHLEATIPVARPINPVSGTNWELVGVTPDILCASGDALDRALAFLAR